MFVVNEDNSIFCTRGDIGIFGVTFSNKAKDGTETPYTFKIGDEVQINVYGKKNCENVVLTKTIVVTEDTEKAVFELTEADTKIEGVISKPKDYWYEIVLNPETAPQTIVGYDEEGPVLFRLYPEAEKPTEDGEDAPVITPEDIAVVDAELSALSDRPIQNKAVAIAVALLQNKINEIIDALGLDVEQI